MRLGLSQASYRWVSYPGLRIDQPEYGFRGLPYPYGTTAEPPAELEGALEWWVERCEEWGLDNLYTSAALLDGKDEAAAVGRLLAEHGIEWVGSVNGAWAVDRDEWPAVLERAAMHFEWMQAGGVRTSAMVNADPPGPPGQPMPNGGLRFGHFSTETPIAVQIDRMIHNLSQLVVEAEKRGIVLAFENHMDYRISEIVQVVEAVASPWLRINYDFANCYSVVEDQVDAAHMAAPYTVMTHLKDMRVQSITTTGEPQFFHAPVGYGSVEIAEIMEILQQNVPDPDYLPHCIETCCLPQYDPQLWMKLTIEWLEANCAEYFPKRFAGAGA